MVRISIDKEADAAYVYLSHAPVARSMRLDERRIIDYTSDGVPCGIDLLYVSDGVDVHDLPDEAAVARLLKEHGVRSLAA
ncbi:MAG: DUF2283 domain-containing protein [Dehalococcoidia bacterium]|nr:DUF2283 domain-containing protein [Dehalococcoidia bacterium]